MKIHRVDVAMSQGPRPEMQDVCLVSDEVHDRTEYFGVFDGHGEAGALVARLAAERLDVGVAYARYRNVAKKAMYAAKLLAELDADIKEHQSWSGGATATFAALKGNVLGIAHLGDSDAFYYQDDGKVVHLTRPHGIRNASEVARVHALGYTSNEHYFINGPYKLAVSRSVGDIEYPFAIAKAEISKYKLNIPGTLVLATDGVWGSNYHHAHRTIQSSIRLGKTETLSHDLVNVFTQYTGDNAAVITVDIR